MAKAYHPWHLVDPSPWPYVGSFGALGMTVGGVMYFHSYMYGDLLLISSMLVVIGTMIVWWRDVIREGTYQGHHTYVVQRGLKWGMLLFILSEVMFFFSFFWAFFSLFTFSLYWIRSTMTTYWNFCYKCFRCTFT
jgi:hypothetical protein